jgi:PEP-CTERM motif
MTQMAFITLLLLLCTTAARADEIYSYTGPAPADLSGSFTTPGLLVPDGTTGLSNALFTNVLSWDFTDGVDTWTPANSSFGGTAFINPDRSFAVWAFSLYDAATGVHYAYSLTLYGAFYYQDDTPMGDSWVANQDLWAKPMDAWTMTDQVATPEPGTLALLGIGLGALLARRGRQVGIIGPSAARPNN